MTEAAGNPPSIPHLFLFVRPCISIPQEEFTTKYGMFGEKLKTEEEIAREKREHTHRLYMMSDVPEYVEISGKWLAAEGELREYRDQCLKQGMELMTKYFRNLWD